MIHLKNSVLTRPALMLGLIGFTCSANSMFAHGMGAYGHAISANAARGKSAEDEVRALETAWDTALVQKDRAALNRIVADDFVLTNADGTTATKAQLLDGVAASDVTIDPFSTEDVVVRVEGDTAVLTGRFTQTGKYKGTSFKKTCRFTDVYVKRDGQWRAVSAQATPVPSVTYAVGQPS